MVTIAPAALEAAPSSEASDISASQMQAPAAVQDTGSAASSEAESAVTAENEQETENSSDQETEESPSVFSFFSSMVNLFDAAPPEQLAESKLAAAPAAIDAALDDPASGESVEVPSSVLNSMPLEVPAEDSHTGMPFAAESPAPSVNTERVSVYGSEARSRLLAMIGSQEDSLPQEAELTRLVHVSLIPDDAYGSEETMDISIYGDFVYCSLHPVEGGSVVYRADCSLKELDSFLADCLATPAPSAAPTPDPYTAEAPVPTMSEISAPIPAPSSAETSAPTTATAAEGNGPEE